MNGRTKLGVSGRVSGLRLSIHRTKELAKVGDLPVLVVCRNGGAARGACARLVKANFTLAQGPEAGVNA